MDINILNGKKHIHFIGIGGSGMYPLAQILHSQGYYLTGSDNNETETLDAVRKMGIPVFIGQRAENDYVGVSCGIMDQFASAMGSEHRAIYLDTATLKYEYAPCDFGCAGLIICNSKG